jgi:hypothetical protein
MEHLTLPLLHMSLAFPWPRGRACITVVYGAFQIQQLPPTFKLRMCNLCFPMKILFHGIWNCQGRILVLFIVPRPIQGHVGQNNTQRMRGYSILPILKLIALIPHNNLPRRAKTYRPLLRLDQDSSPCKPHPYPRLE